MCDCPEDDGHGERYYRLAPSPDPCVWKSGFTNGLGPGKASQPHPEHRRGSPLMEKGMGSTSHGKELGTEKLQHVGCCL